MGLIGDVAQLIADNKELENLAGEILSALTVNMGRGLVRCTNKAAYEQFLILRKSWADRLKAVTHKEGSTVDDSIALAKVKARAWDAIDACAPGMRVLRCTPTVTRPSDSKLENYTDEIKMPGPPSETLEEDVVDPLFSSAMATTDDVANVTEIPRSPDARDEIEPVPHPDPEVRDIADWLQNELTQAGVKRLRELAEETGFEPDKFKPDNAVEKVVFNNHPFHDSDEVKPVEEVTPSDSATVPYEDTRYESLDSDEISDETFEKSERLEPESDQGY